ncbi:hypothetical protein DKP76_10560 [Falsochrobactrum shanghaiense]|uniref:Uncharacterized protein n=1 Tax=Falsochrobactrum shanghaiense TaxID=2201899 RepID=A0A316J880_9HYPH|nr:hypothetical protein [Falsochrobactrum shanghaiense]PWL18152.1 hypothetical protein DKP76_10560 [Falsochrobactrum shanghaiense]
MTAIDRMEKAMVSALKQALASRKSVLVPPGGNLLWEWFMDLNAVRTWHMNGPNPISYADIVSYGQINRWSIQPHHVAILRAMDAAYVEYFYSQRENKSEENVSRQPTGELSADLFDAVFG